MLTPGHCLALVLKLNQMYEEVSAIVTLCHDASPASSPSICARMYTDMEAMTTRVMNLMTTFQQRKLLHTNSCTNVNLAGCACLVMAAVRPYHLPILRPTDLKIDSECGLT